MAQIYTISVFKKILFYLVILAIFISIVIAGLSWPLGFGAPTIWPWNKGWFMFSYSFPYAQHLVVKGVKKDGSLSEIRLEEWFHYQASPMNKRYDELSRGPEITKALALFICQKDPSLAKISIYDYWWYTVKGKRVNLGERLENQKYTLLENLPCPNRAS